MMYDLSESQYTQDGGDYNNDWNELFANILIDLRSLESAAEADGSKGYEGVAKILRSYAYNMSVDFWNDVPFTDAGFGAANLTPAPDDGAFIYDQVLLLLDEAIDDLNSPNVGTILSDVFYAGDIDDWKRLANSIKLRMFINLRLIDADRARQGIEDVLASPDGLIRSNDQNFVFQYGSSTNPQNTHPMYQQDLATADKTFYMSNYFMQKLLENDDPRINYYVYRQDDGSNLNFQTTPCSQRTDCPVGYLGAINSDWAGYIGRDHGDPSGLPGDNTLRTTWGVYPAGGAFDEGRQRPVRTELQMSMNQGAGVMPFITASMVDFWWAEAVVTMGVSGEAVALLSSGIEKSMNFVSEVASRIEQAPAIPDTQITNYAMAIVTQFNTASTDDSKLDVVITQKYIAEFGNGLEAWTDVRRTGFPSDRPASIVPAAPFPLRLPYGLQEVNTNPNISQVSQAEPVFWDE